MAIRFGAWGTGFVLVSSTVMSIAACSLPAELNINGVTIPGAAPPQKEAQNHASAAPVQKSVGASGGDVTTSDGSGVEVPPGAVPADVDVSVAPAHDAPPPPETVEPVGMAYTLGPSGLQFAVPVTVVLAFDPAKLPAGKSAKDIVVFTAQDGTADYKPLPTELRDETHVAALTTHFSVFVPTLPTDAYVPPTTTPDAGPGDCQARLCGYYGPGACGVLSDGCGKEIVCGPCKPGSNGDAGTGPSGPPPQGGPPDGGKDPGPMPPGPLPDGGFGPPPFPPPPVDGGNGPKPSMDGGGGTCMPLTCGHYPKLCGATHDGCGADLYCIGGCEPVSDAGPQQPPKDAGEPCLPTGVCTADMCGHFFDGCGLTFCGGGCGVGPKPPEGGNPTGDAGPPPCSPNEPCGAPPVK